MFNDSLSAASCIVVPLIALPATPDVFERATTEACAY
jgi:hypothetical protein